MIVGPTAVGKTELSLKLAHKYNGEIISCDSMQVYQHLDIGTAKIPEAKREGIPHHLLSIRTVNQRYTVSDFVEAALQQFHAIRARHHLPIVVGGSCLYLQSLIDNFSFGGQGGSLAFRHQLEKQAANLGQQGIWERLKQVDPASAEKIPPENERRVIRALEITLKSGHKFSEQKVEPRRNLNLLIIGLHTDRQLLYKRINQRVDQMVQAGLVKEAQWLYQQGGAKLPAGMGIGYHELYPYFAKEITLDRAITLIKRDSRHYAKHQLSWFRHRMPIHWYNLIQNPKTIQQMNLQIKSWLNK